MYKVQSKSELRGTKGIWSYHEEKEEDENTSILDERFFKMKVLMNESAVAPHERVEGEVSVVFSQKKETCHCNHDA